MPELLRPREGLVVERAVGDGRFVAERGPVRHYLRTVTVEEQGGGLARVAQTVEFRLAIPYFGFLFVLPFKRAVVANRASAPWWAPPDSLDARAASVLATLAVVSFLGGYLGSIFSQTVAFASEGFRVGEAEQGIAGSIVRAGGVLALAIAAVADRRGRRFVLLASAALGAVLAATGALAPSLSWLTGTQVLARSLAVALLIVVGIVVSEEMPAGARAYAVSLLGMAAAGGAGLSLVALPLADLHEDGWRLLYLIPLLALPFLPGVARHLPESRRFAAPHRELGLASLGRRFALLAVSAFIYNLSAAPASFFLNRYLRVEHGFSAAEIALFLVATNLPGAIGIVAGGRLADTRGRRPVGAVALAGGTVAGVLFFSSSEPALWVWSGLWSLIGAAALPALGVYGPELFPTSLRGRANGLIAAIGLAGSGTGLLVAGFLSDATGRLAPAMTILAAGPLALAVLVLVAYPETSHKELEELNPEDQPP